MKFGLSQNTIDKLASVFKTFAEIEAVIIYGSRAKGNFRPGSDIDITLKGEQINHELLLKLASAIDDLNTPYLYDISDFKQLHSASLIDHINRVGQVMYQKEKQLV